MKSEDAYELETLQQVKVVEKLSKLKFHSYRRAHSLAAVAAWLYTNKDRENNILHWANDAMFPPDIKDLPRVVTYGTALKVVMKHLERECKSYDGAEAEYRKEIAEEVSIRQAHIKAVDELSRLPQIFIAV